MQLALTDRSVTVQRESSTALGQGCRLGFLGTLHMDVFRQRLEDEHDANIIITAPTVSLLDLWFHFLLRVCKVPYKSKVFLLVVSGPVKASL